MSLIDSHCHLDSPEFDADREAVIERALEAGVDQMLAIGTGSGPPDLEAGVRMAEKYPAFYATVGIHPHDAAKAGDADLKRLAELLAHPKVLAVGEIGLDYHYDFSPRDTQRAIFAEQMTIAAAAHKPMVIHTREAWDDTLALVEEHWKPHGLGGIMHCFSGSPAEARRAVELGFYLSFGGIATFPKAVEVRAAAQSTPRDRILVETDAPYLAPVPKRGKRNEPALIVHTAHKLAEVRGESYEDLCRITSENFRKLLLG
ncbi:MAG TPA: TatD family hydrolase [Bryobacteraceae bacterium]|nr:TatD family hydrolase [Bryobacteraceae bacterium]